MKNINEVLPNAGNQNPSVGRLDVGPRVPERTEIFAPKEAMTYIEGCDFPETSDYAIVAAEIALAFGNRDRISGSIVEVCPGPGNLCGELLGVGADRVTGIDGSPVMIGHARKKFSEQIAAGQMEFIPGLAQQLPLANNSVDGIVNFNSFHQFRVDERAFGALVEMARVLKPGGWGLIRDFKRGTTHQNEFINKRSTRDDIKKMLKVSFNAAFTPDEFTRFLEKIPGIEFQVTDTQNPWRLSEALCERMRKDPVAHWMDFLISQHVIIRKCK
jgi:SAM-dependent methyltransferase